jgi:hypothetical protein
MKTFLLIDANPASLMVSTIALSEAIKVDGKLE